MASVDEHAWKMCRACKAVKRTKPARTKGCTCKAVAWRARWRTPEGKSRSEVFDRKRDADVRKAEVETTRSRGAYVDTARGRQKFMAYADEWAAARDWKLSTREKSWPQARRRLVLVFGDRTLASVDKLALEKARGELADTYARGVVEGTMARAKAILKHAYANGAIGRDVTVGVASAPKLRSGDKLGVSADQVPTRAEALNILTSTASGWRAAIALGLAGLRVGEVLGLHAEDVNLFTREVTVRQQTDGYALTTVKNEKERTITVPGLVAVELRRHLRDHPTGLLFPGGGRRECSCGCGHMLTHTSTFYSLAWWPALVKAGFKLEGKGDEAKARFTFHGLRHFCASTLLAEGAPLTAVAGHIGDDVQTVSRTYLHWLRDDRHVPAEVLDRVFAETAEEAAETSGEPGVSPSCHDDEREAI